MTSRRSWLVAVCAVSALLTGGATAYACTASAQLGLSGDAGAPASRVTVEGTNFVANRPVELHWNTLTGPVLATASGPSFSVPVTIPDAAPGVAYVVAVQQDADGNVWKAPASFEVTSDNPVARAGGSGRTEAPRATSDNTKLLPAIAVGFLAVGAVSLIAGFALIEARRRRRVAGSNTSYH